MRISWIILVMFIVIGVIIVIGSPRWYNDLYINKIIEQAVSKNDSLLCEKLDPDLLFQGYMDVGVNSQPIKDCYAKVAIDNKNINACPKHWVYNYICLGAYFTYVKDTDPKICEVFQEGQKRDECYYEQSRALYDASFCELIKSNETKSSCYSQIH